MRCADWYFDFVSPYAYFGLLRLEELRGQLDIRYCPVLFAELLRHWEQKGPAEIPAKRAWTYRWCTWLAAQQQIPFRFPARHPFNPLPYLRLAIAADRSVHAITTIYSALWTTGADPTDDRVIAELTGSLAIDRARLTDPQVKEELRSLTEQAVARGVFGVPTLIVDEQMFWGADATDLIKAYLADPAIVATEEMKRLASLPIGAARKLY